MANEKLYIDCISDYEKVLKDRNIAKSNFLLSEFDDKFKITKHKDGEYPAIITISGFCSEDVDNRINWRDYILKAYLEREWFHIEWNSEKWPFTTKEKDSTPILYKDNLDRATTNPFVNLLLSFTTAGRATLITKSVIDNFWHRAVRNARIAGQMLAMILDACPKRNFILVGHSLGARIIYNCLEELNRHCSTKKIVEAHLFGGAVGNDAVKWGKACEQVFERVHNYYSNKDMVLRFAYSISMLSFKPIGLNRIAYGKIANHDFSTYVSGHSSYFSVISTESDSTSCADCSPKSNRQKKRRKDLANQLRFFQQKQKEHDYQNQKKKYGNQTN